MMNGCDIVLTKINQWVFFTVFGNLDFKETMNEAVEAPDCLPAFPVSPEMENLTEALPSAWQPVPTGM